MDEHRRVECAFWTTFWGQVPTDKRLKRINSWVHREYLRLFERCLAQCWRDWPRWPQPVREQVLRSLVTFINGLTASAVANPGDWPAAKQIGTVAAAAAAAARLGDAHHRRRGPRSRRRAT